DLGGGGFAFDFAHVSPRNLSIIQFNVDYFFSHIFAIAGPLRLAISSGLRSSMCVAIDHMWPNGSFNWPLRSPQNILEAGKVTVAPAATACFIRASTSLT